MKSLLLRIFSHKQNLVFVTCHIKNVYQVMLTMVVLCMASRVNMIIAAGILKVATSLTTPVHCFIVVRENYKSVMYADLAN